VQVLSTQLRDQFQRQPRELAHSFGHIAGELNIILGLCDQAHRSRDVRFVALAAAGATLIFAIVTLFAALRGSE